jgi:hypothetical protein
MSTPRDQSLAAILDAITASRLPASHTDPLRDALVALHAERPNAVDKVQAPLGRALRNPLFTDIWTRCVDDIPQSPAYAPLREAAGAIAELVRQKRG